MKNIIKWICFFFVISLPLLMAGCSTCGKSDKHYSNYDEFHSFYNLTIVNAYVRSVQVKRTAEGIFVKVVKKYGIFSEEEEVGLDASFVKNFNEIECEYTECLVVFIDEESESSTKPIEGCRSILVTNNKASKLKSRVQE